MHLHHLLDFASVERAKIGVLEQSFVYLGNLMDDSMASNLFKVIPRLSHTSLY